VGDEAHGFGIARNIAGCQHICRQVFFMQKYAQFIAPGKRLLA
jgi:hypothetical protein